MKEKNEGSGAFINLQIYNVDNKEDCHKSSVSILAELTHNDVEKLDRVNIACGRWQKKSRVASKLDVDHWCKSRAPAAHQYARSSVKRACRDARTTGISTIPGKNGKDASPGNAPPSLSPGNFATTPKDQENLTRVISCDTGGVLNHQDEGLNIQYSETLVPIISCNNPDPSRAQMPPIGHGDNASHDWPAVTDSFQTWRIPGGCINIHAEGVHPCHDIYFHSTSDDQQPTLVVIMME